MAFSNGASVSWTTTRRVAWDTLVRTVYAFKFGWVYDNGWTYLDQHWDSYASNACFLSWTYDDHIILLRRSPSHVAAVRYQRSWPTEIWSGTIATSTEFDELMGIIDQYMTAHCDDLRRSGLPAIQQERSAQLQSELLYTLEQYGWVVTRYRVARDHLAWFHEIWVLKSRWSPHGFNLFLTFLIDPQPGNPSPFWEISTSFKLPAAYTEACGEPRLIFTPNWVNDLPKFVANLNVVRQRGLSQ